MDFNRPSHKQSHFKGIPNPKVTKQNCDQKITKYLRNVPNSSVFPKAFSFTQ